MAIGGSCPMIETGNNSPHGEMFRLVYNTKIYADQCGDHFQLVPPIGGILYWDFYHPVVDGPLPFSGTFPPTLPNPARLVPEAYIPAAAGVPGHFPIAGFDGWAGHQNNLGVCSYAMMGVSQLGDPRGRTDIRMPAGIVVVDNVAGPNGLMFHPAIGGGGPTFLDYCGDAIHDWYDRLYIIKTRGVVQMRVDALCDNIAPGSYIEGVIGSWDGILDAADANKGTFKSLEVCVADNTMIYVMLVGLVY